MKSEIRIHGAGRAIDFDRSRNEAAIDGRKIAFDAVAVAPGVYSILLNGRSFEVTVERSGESWLVRTAGREFQIEYRDPRAWRGSRGGNIELEGRQQLTAPMPGKIVRVLAKQGQSVEAGDGLLVIEAMKMQNEIRSPKSGTVERLAREGQTVNAGEILAVVS
ncbi:MAG: acetyl-CoA carboxylase biotin carboxyl carrier protein subunit [Candidatus Acidiferrales bacterium]